MFLFIITGFICRKKYVNIGNTGIGINTMSPSGSNTVQPEEEVGKAIKF